MYQHMGGGRGFHSSKPVTNQAEGEKPGKWGNTGEKCMKHEAFYG